VSDEKIKEEICALERSTEQTMKELRQTIYGKSFEGETFSSRLREYMQEMQRLSDTQLNLELDDRVEQMTSAQKIAAYRIICEGVSNALRHGKATHTDVSIRMDESNIILKVADNGDGFKREESKPLEGNGLNNINRMVQLLAGQVSIGPDEPKGTRLMAQIPLH
ncbi:MAG: sensor histidine kinase, partial [Pygmaiobacter massiliensis]